MIKLIMVLCFFLVCNKIYSQNLVPNYSFEEYTMCPDNGGQIDRLIGWYSPSNGTCDFFHTCSPFMDPLVNSLGGRTPLNGNGYLGFFISLEMEEDPLYTFREYLQIQLNSPLVSGTMYYVSFSVSVADSSFLATDDIGLYLSNDSLVDYSLYGNFNVTPQVENVQGDIMGDPSQWYNITGQYIANGGEQFITIGNFKDEANTTKELVYTGATVMGPYFGYYYVDEVCISIYPDDCKSSVGIIPKEKNEKKLIGIIDALGRQCEFKSNALLIYIYSDGSSEKVFVIE